MVSSLATVDLAVGQGCSHRHQTGRTAGIEQPQVLGIIGKDPCPPLFLAYDGYWITIEFDRWDFVASR